MVFTKTIPRFVLILMSATGILVMINALIPSKCSCSEVVVPHELVDMDLSKNSSEKTSKSVPDSITSVSDGESCQQAQDWFLEDPNLEQDNPRLLNYISKYHLEPPSQRPYREGVVGINETGPFAPIIQAIFKGKRNGFFVEAGAFNGVNQSPTLTFERDFGWTGLLIEGNSFILPELRQVFRKAWIADVCLAMTPYPQKVKFTHVPDEPVAAMIKYGDIGPNPSNAEFYKRNEARKDDFISAGFVECFPIYSMLAALNVTSVDYFSLDVEGAELDVLRNIPFEKINIKVFSVEYQIVEGGIPALDDFFDSKDYKHIGVYLNDVFYIQNALLDKYTVDENISKNAPINSG